MTKIVAPQIYREGALQWAGRCQEPWVPEPQSCAFQMGCAEDCSLSENITVPDTKVNFYAWNRMEVSSCFLPLGEAHFENLIGVGGRMTEEMKQQRGELYRVHSFIPLFIQKPYCILAVC